MKPRIDPAALLANASWVERLARSLLKDEALAADLAQDVMAVAIERPPAYEGTGHQLRSWLGGVTRKLARSHIRERAERHQRESQAARPEFTHAEAAASERLRLHEQLTQAVMALAEPYRTTIVLRFLEDLAPREIAKRRQIPAVTVRKHLSRGLEQLRLRLDKEHGDRRAWCTALIGLARSGAPPTASAAATTLSVIIMKKLSIVSATGLVLALGLWTISGITPDADLSSQDNPSAVTSLNATNTASITTPDEPERQRLATEIPTALAAYEVNLRNQSGTPIAGAKLWLVTDAGDTQRAETDDRGNARLPRSDSASRLLAVAEGYLLADQELDKTTGPHQVILNRGSELQGWLRVDDAVPTEPIQLELRFNESSTDLHLPDALSREIEDVRATNTTTTTRHDGEFHFQSLPETWSGSLLLPQQYWFLGERVDPDQERRLLLAGPSSGLHLEATQLPIVSGRVVWIDDHSPVPTAFVSLQAVFSNGWRSVGLGESVEEDGRFRLGLWPGSTLHRDAWRNPNNRPSLTTVNVTVSAPTANQRRGLTFNVEGGTANSDLGTIALHRGTGRTLHFRVTDRTGTPIAKAYVLGKILSPASAADGQGTVVPPEPRPDTWLVGALGYRIEELTPKGGDGSQDNPLLYVLDRGNQLTIRLLDADQNPLPRTRLDISTPGLLYDSGDGAVPTKIHRAVAMKIPSYSWGDHGSNLQIESDHTGNVVLASLRPHVPLTLEVTDRLGQVAAHREILGPGPREEMSSDLLVIRPLRSVPVRVFDALGEPLPNAQLKLGRRRQTITGYTDTHGRFAFTDIYESETPVTLTAQHAGHAGLRREIIVSGADITPIEMHLHRGQDLRISVIDSQGKSVSVPTVWVELPEPRAEVQALGDGVFQFRDLPSGLLRFTCNFGTESYSMDHDSKNPTATMIVPRPGSLTARVRWHKVRPSATLRVSINPAGHPKANLTLIMQEAKGIWTATTLLTPGAYELRLWRYDGDHTTWKPSGPPRRCTVAAGEVSRVNLDH